ncbi:hypothetical protein [Mycobacterium sp. 29Ha]|uniref:hypothetical protein n=1 Tax=Mycobacterium sp. 29Ha TaxID=2939268 RepID=UPI0029391758|nr:hypothetical protein [Mycobacterium sp. 29Ha]MDV3131362.1 hypothetical protein [Mycobacterium sp. 29Ha]
MTVVLVSDVAGAAVEGGEAAVLGAAAADEEVGEEASETPAIVKLYEPVTGWPSAETTR